MREDQFLRQRLQKEIPIEISPVLRDLITVIFYFKIYVYEKHSDY